jgi:hypothetical protein
MIVSCTPQRCTHCCSECGLGDAAAVNGVPMHERLVILQKIGQGALILLLLSFNVYLKQHARTQYCACSTVVLAAMM